VIGFRLSTARSNIMLFTRVDARRHRGYGRVGVKNRRWTDEWYEWTFGWGGDRDLRRCFFSRTTTSYIVESKRAQGGDDDVDIPSNVHYTEVGPYKVRACVAHETKKGKYYLETKKQPRVRACVNKYYVKTFKLDDKREKITRIGRRSSSYSADQIPKFPVGPNVWKRIFPYRWRYVFTERNGDGFRLWRTRVYYIGAKFNFEKTSPPFFGNGKYWDFRGCKIGPANGVIATNLSEPTNVF